MAVNTSELETLRGKLVGESSDAIWVEAKGGKVHRIGKGMRMHELSRRKEDGDEVVTFVMPMLDVMMLEAGLMVV